MKRRCLRCGYLTHEVWRLDEAVGKADIWCVSCGMGHRVDGCVLRAVLDPEASGRWMAIPEGTLAVMERGLAE